MSFDPFTLPVHPAVVHFPVAMLSAAWVCLVLRYLTGKAHWDQRSRLFEVIGVAALPVVIGAAFIDTAGVEFIARPRWDKPLIWHAVIASAAAVTFTTHYLWRRARPLPAPGRAAVLDLGLATTGLWLLVVAGLIAGEMVYGT